ncbi:SR-related and CTD-associated factor 4 [Anopheles cruzii]|uniref:SR-related and CTD-associated factor 4 n=1 Tax=Anopheles cruzii TaxID=68878 RepID=UPI0022EC4E28|nr:SR-related and CTD-associated factor 4 [Anopheles cruzii]
METVRVFNQELSGLYESKPPISKAKMASITRSAMKAIKFYKHVVQSVEKFIQKCKCEYKIPGLYVIDSIVRQSRHQFGPEKDVFAPRFARNMEATFAHLFRCPPEDKSKIIRVLNLWQKNMVFLPEVIQPLFDLANPDHPIHQQYHAQAALQEQAGANGMNSAGGLMLGSPAGPSMGSGLDDHGGPLQLGETKQLDPNTIRQLQQFQQILMRQTSGDAAAAAAQASKDQVKFNKKLLDFDYGSEEEEDKSSPSVPHGGSGAAGGLPDLTQMPGGNIAQILSDPNVLKQLQNLQKLKQQEEKQSKLTEMRLQEEKFEKHLASVLMKLPFANECDLSRQPPIDLNAGHSSAKDVDTDNDVAITGVEILGDPMPMGGGSSGRGGGGGGNVGGGGGSGNNDRYKSSSSSSRRKSRSRSPRDRRGGGGSGGGASSSRRGRASRSHSRSRSASRSPRSSRRRSSRDRGSSNKEREREKEHERERKRKGLPEIKKEHLSVCSTTLWVGHLSKLVQQEELSDTFGKYGDIVSIDMIPPRGCAFIVMNRRQDAFKCMQSLKNHKMHGRAITISWAAGKGVKSKEWKDYWDLDLGVSYIPWPKLGPSTDLDSLEDGGMFDEDTMPGWMKEKAAPGGGSSGAPGVAGGSSGVGITAQGMGMLAPGMGLKKLDGSDLSTAAAAAAAAAGMLNPSLFPLGAVDTSQPPPTAMLGMGLPPFPMGAVTRLPLSMGIPMGPNMVSGLGINVPPPGMMLPGNPPPLPLGGFGVLPPPPPTAGLMGNGSAASASLLSAVAAVSNMSKSSADDMDIEMEDESTPNTGPLGPVAPGGGGHGSAFFNQPPPPLLPPSLGNLPPGPPAGSAAFFGGPPLGGGNMSDNGGGSGDDGADGGGGDSNGRGARDFRSSDDGGRDHHHRGRRSRDRDQQPRGNFDRGNDGRGGGDAGGGGGGRRDRGERGSRWGGGNNFRSGDNTQDDRPLSERLRELAGVLEFSHQQQRAAGAGGATGGGRNFGGRGGGDGDGDFGNADFTRRGGSNYQQNRFNNSAGGGDREGGRGGDGGGRNQGGRNGQFSNHGGAGGNRNSGGMFGNRLGGRNNNQRGGGGQFFNEDRQQQGAFFDRDDGGGNGYDSGGNNSNSNSNRRNWNERGGRGNNGNRDDGGNRGRGRQNWRSGDEGPGSGGDGGQPFNARGSSNRSGGGNAPTRAVRWEDDDDNWNAASAGGRSQSNRDHQQSGGRGEGEQEVAEKGDRAQQEGGPSVGEEMMVRNEESSSHRAPSEHGGETRGNDVRENEMLGTRRGDDESSSDRRYGRDHHRRQRNDDPDDERPQPILYSPEQEDDSEQTNNLPDEEDGRTLYGNNQLLEQQRENDHAEARGFPPSNEPQGGSFLTQDDSSHGARASDDGDEHRSDFNSEQQRYEYDQQHVPELQSGHNVEPHNDCQPEQQYDERQQNTQEFEQTSPSQSRDNLSAPPEVNEDSIVASKCAPEDPVAAETAPSE